MVTQNYMLGDTLGGRGILEEILRGIRKNSGQDVCTVAERVDLLESIVYWGAGEGAALICE